jgi:hypothetical protein
MHMVRLANSVTLTRKFSIKDSRTILLDLEAGIMGMETVKGVSMNRTLSSHQPSVIGTFWGTMM